MEGLVRTTHLLLFTRLMTLLIKYRQYSKGGGRMTKEKKAAYDREYHKRNRERRAAQNKKWCEENKELRELSRKKYTETAKGKLSKKVRSQRRRVRKRNAEGSYTLRQLKEQRAIQQNKCYYCCCELNETAHIEHKTPLCRGGSNWIENIALSCPSCNLSKGTKTVEEFNEYK